MGLHQNKSNTKDTEFKSWHSHIDTTPICLLRLILHPFLHLICLFWPFMSLCGHLTCLLTILFYILCHYLVFSVSFGQLCIYFPSYLCCFELNGPWVVTSAFVPEDEQKEICFHDYVLKSALTTADWQRVKKIIFLDSVTFMGLI